MIETLIPGDPKDARGAPQHEPWSVTIACIDSETEGIRLMITFRTSTEITADRRVVLTLPAETPEGEVELFVTIAPKGAPVASRGVLRHHFGVVRSGDSQSADSERIGADLDKALGRK